MLRYTVHAPTDWADRALDAAVTAGVVVLVLVGFATSYHTLLDLAVTQGGYPPWLAPAVPLSFDLGIVVLSLKVTQAAREGRHAPILRLLIASLSAATVVANAAAVPGVAGRLLHAVPPAMFVTCFESVVITARRRALQARGIWPEPIPRQHPLRWILAPQTTWTTWRTSVLAQSPSETERLAPRPLVHSAHAQTPSTAAVPGDTRAADRPAKDPRRGIVVAALRGDANISAPALREMLTHHGFSVSLRTAQRLRSTATSHLHTEHPLDHGDRSSS